MRAERKGKHGIGKRFALLIGATAVGVIALGAQTVIAQTAAQPPAVVKYDTKLTITHEAAPGRTALWHGGVQSDRTECMGGRRVILFQQRPGADRKLGADRSRFSADQAVNEWWSWGLRAPVPDRVYARVTPKVGDGFVCRADRSPNICEKRVKGGPLPRLCAAASTSRDDAVGTKGHPRS
jgi:hypothetical protein